MRLLRTEEFNKAHPEAGALLESEQEDYLALVGREDPEAAALIQELRAPFLTRREKGKGEKAEK